MASSALFLRHIVRCNSPRHLWQHCLSPFFPLYLQSARNFSSTAQNSSANSALSSEKIPRSRNSLHTNENSLQQTVLTALQRLRHPNSASDLLYSSQITKIDTENGAVAIELVPDKDYRQIKRLIIEEISKVQGVSSVSVAMNSPKSPKSLSAGASSSSPRPDSPENGLSRVKNIIAVSSCKGGVGKSTVAVNLAYSLAQLDHSVGLFDADLYGPSLPTLVKPENFSELKQNLATKLIEPVISHGVRTMSYGYVALQQNSTQKSSRNPSELSEILTLSGAAMIRGAMANNILKELLLRTDWGELDFLVIDFPPGTGDIQLTLSQICSISGAIVITTPQKLSYVDVVKGVEFFIKTNIPILALIENMAYFLCDSCDKKHQLFGPGFSGPVAQQFKIQNSYKFPLLPDISRASDSGLPLILHNSSSTQQVRALYLQIAQQIAESLEEFEAKRAKLPIFHYEKAENLIVIKERVEEGPEQGQKNQEKVKYVSPRQLRYSCRCAGCVDELSGRRMIDWERISKDIRPLGQQYRGNYAVAVAWSDNHASSLYSFEQIKELAHDNKQKAATWSPNTQ
jgi:Mrp family chromosome partitioning ATPase/DUF971 family protein